MEGVYKMDFKKIDTWLYRNKEGMIVGALVGGAIYYFNIAIPYLVFKPEISTSTKLATLVFVGMTIGAIIDSKWRPTK